MRRPRFILEHAERDAIVRAAGLVAAGVVAGIAIASLWFETRSVASNSAATSPTSTPGVTTADPLAVEYSRCLALGEAGSRDEACLRLWAENRRRFLKPSATPPAAAPIEMPDPPKADDRLPVPPPDLPAGIRRKGP